MKIKLPLFDNVGMPLLGVLATFLFVAEARRGLRSRTRPKIERLAQNSSVAALALPALRLLLLPCMYEAANKSSSSGIGLLHRLLLPSWAAYPLGFLLLDYTNYLWHVLLHKSEVLWRFHTVHHIDLDLDLSTAWRFHVGENIASAPYRSAAVFLIGAPAPLVLFYEVIFEACTAFHHTNLRLPVETERILSKVMVTPRMHGIHHSIVARETNSNFSVVFSWWDRVSNTLRLNVPQEEITIGVPGYRDPAEQSPLHLLTLPFQRQRSWQLPDGTVPDRIERHQRTYLCP